MGSKDIKWCLMACLVKTSIIPIQYSKNWLNGTKWYISLHGHRWEIILKCVSVSADVTQSFGPWVKELFTNASSSQKEIARLGHTLLLKLDAKQMEHPFSCPKSWQRKGEVGHAYRRRREAAQHLLGLCICLSSLLWMAPAYHRGAPVLPLIPLITHLLVFVNYIK